MEEITTVLWGSTLDLPFIVSQISPREPGLVIAEATSSMHNNVMDSFPEARCSWRQWRRFVNIGLWSMYEVLSRQYVG